uniref:ABC transmembrane type-1 domain-containing protein n=1 Tax=Ditylenchus dipsaci TaxID=166011 RepID=A0A915DMW2_9BILA
MFVLLCRADRHSTTYERLGTKPESPESTSSAISSLLYWYASKMIWKGLKATVDFDELWALEKENQAEFLRDKFLATGRNRSPEALIKMKIFIWRIMLCTWRPLLVSCLVVPFLVLFRFGLSVFLTMIVVSVENSYPLWCSISALCCLFAMDLFNKTLYARRDVMSFISYLNVRLILIIAIFDKMLKLSPAAKTRYSAGEIVNLATTDVQRVRLCWFQLRDFIYCPLMMIVGLLGLFYVLGVNTCYGIAVLFLIMPINFYISKRMAHYEQVQMKYKDARLKLVNDILSGMKVLKLYAWELSMQKMVSEVRRKETNTLKNHIHSGWTDHPVFQFGPVLATFVSFFGYTVIQGNPLRPEVAFVSLMFFIMLRFAIYQIPQLMTNCIKAFHIYRQIVNESLPKDTIVLSKCSFTWEDVKAESYNKHLQDITLDVKRGDWY